MVIDNIPKQGKKSMEDQRMDEQGRRICEGILAMFSPTMPIIVNPAFYQILKDAGLPMEDVMEQKPLLMWGCYD